MLNCIDIEKYSLAPKVILQMFLKTTSMSCRIRPLATDKDTFLGHSYTLSSVKVASCLISISDHLNQKVFSSFGARSEIEGVFIGPLVVEDVGF
jgi:hypothetical protein